MTEVTTNRGPSRECRAKNHRSTSAGRSRRLVTSVTSVMARVAALRRGLSRIAGGQSWPGRAAGVEPMSARDGEERLDRLIAAIESQVNVVNRLVQTLEAKQKRGKSAAATRLQRAVLDRPIVVTPMVEAAVKRAFARMRK